MKYIFFTIASFNVVFSASAQSLTKGSSKHPNILWITCEDISPYIGAYGFKEVSTPNIDKLAKEGVRYKKVYTVAGVCAPSRSAIITGMYPMSIGTQHMRTGGDPKYQPVPPYSAVIPSYVKCFPEYLRKAGYYCTNNEKQDYQFDAPVTVWDENGPGASFRNRQGSKPFFAVFNFFITHESQLFSRKDSLLVDPDSVTVPPLYQDTKTVRHDIARMLTNIERMDEEVGDLLQMLKNDGLYNNTIIFFFSDHGGSLPWTKRELLERGTHIPFVIRWPGGAHAGETNDDLVSAIDFAPTVLSLAGITPPAHLQGHAFLGPQKKNPRKYVYAARDRMDTEYDRVRMVRDSQYMYLYNYMPEKPYYQNIEYRLSIPMMKELLTLRDEGKLDSNQAQWFATKPVEELYDVNSDPYAFHNLATDTQYKSKLEELRKVFQNWTKTVGDKSSMPESDMITEMWNGAAKPPVTAMPQVGAAKGGIVLKCATAGASIGYRIVQAGQRPEPEKHALTSWDHSFALGRKNEGSVVAKPVWQVYDGEVIPLAKGDRLLLNAMRIGYQPAITSYEDGKLIWDEEVMK